jgi:hypothetical protein
VPKQWRPESEEERHQRKAYYDLTWEIEQSKGFIWFDRVGNYTFTLSIFEGNLKDLDCELSSLESIDNDYWDDITHMDELTNRAVEIARKLHNYLASVSTLKDHTRKLYDEMREIGKGIPEYDEQIKQSFDTPVVHFVQQLRHYMVHICCPQFIMSGEWNNEIKLKPFVCFSKEDLLKWDKWDAKSLFFIEEIDGEIPIRHAIDDYAAIVHEFTQWFITKIFDLSEEELADLEKRSKLFEELNNLGLKDS